MAEPTGEGLQLLERYSRHLLLLGAESQRKLGKTRVLVAGVGGLGSFIAIHLASLGVGFVRIVDRDVVEPSDLNRQVLYTPNDIGKPKAKVACERLREYNPSIEVECLCRDLSRELLDDIVKDVDVVFDALDNWSSRHLLNEYAVRHRKPLIHGGVYGFYGEVATIVPGETPCLYCIHPRIEDFRRPIPVISPVVSIVASMQVMEFLKLVLGLGTILKNSLLFIDMLRNRFERVVVERNPRCPICSRFSRDL